MAFTSAPLPSFGLVIDTGKSDPGLFFVNSAEGQTLNATQLKSGRLTAGAYGGLALNGQDATLTESTPIAHAAAPIPPFGFLTLSSSGNYVLVSEFGTLSESGQNVDLRKGRSLTSAFGLFAVSVADAERDAEINGDVRLFQTVGQNATMVFSRNVAASYGLFSLNGQESTGISGETSTDKLMPANLGAFVVNGGDGGAITFVRGQILSAAYGAFAINGQSVTLDGPIWQDVTKSSGTWVYVTPSGGTWTDVDPDA